MKIQDYLKQKKLISDGAFGTYFASVCDGEMLPECANLQMPEKVKEIHSEYLRAGAKLIRTNTFAANKESLKCGDRALIKNLQAAFGIAKAAAEDWRRISGKTVFIAGDIGPIPGSLSMPEEESYAEYRLICDTLLEAGADILLFETFTEIERILPVIRDIKKQREIFIIVQLCVNQYGYSNSGISSARLLKEAGNIPEIDALGFNCGVGPGHLYGVLEKNGLPEGKYLTALPNAGYPKLMNNRMVFRENPEYFARKMKEIAENGADIVGGCCGTTPEYIRLLKQYVDTGRTKKPVSMCIKKPDTHLEGRDAAFFKDKKEGEKIIAVELSPPPGADDAKIMEASFWLKNEKVDVITLPDSPSGRTRADSVLMGMKVAGETGLCVMPHICCRDRNAIGMRAQLLGAYINGIRNMLIITGDPVPALFRQEVKSVFNFDSVGLMGIINELNQEEFAGEPVVFGGAINQGRLNLEVEVRRTRKKLEQGARFFLTQPVFTMEDANRLRYIKEKTGARILCGIMPLISLRNALFMKNEMAGINVTEEITARFHENMTREEGEETGIGIAREVMAYTGDFADGYYFSIPFNRVYLLGKILHT